MVPKFWTRIRVVTGILQSQGWGPHIPKLRRALGAPLRTRVGTRSGLSGSRTGAPGWASPAQAIKDPGHRAGSGPLRAPRGPRREGHD